MPAIDRIFGRPAPRWSVRSLDAQSFHAREESRGLQEHVPGNWIVQGLVYALITQLGVESHLRELVEQGFEVMVVRDAGAD